jgi:hypothetical protein
MGKVVAVLVGDAAGNLAAGCTSIILLVIMSIRRLCSLEHENYFSFLSFATKMGTLGKWRVNVHSYFALRMVPPMDEEPPYSSSWPRLSRSSDNDIDRFMSGVAACYSDTPQDKERQRTTRPIL